MQDVPYGYCQCGCGRRTRIAPQNHAPKGWVKGEPIRFVSGHNPQPSRWPERDGQKRCSKCGEVKFVTEFYVRRSGRHEPECKVCRRAAVKAHKRATYIPKPRRLRTTSEGDAYIVDQNGCWIWQRGLNANGYGVYRYADVNGNKRRAFAHRWMYEQHIGPIPDGLVLDHLCRTPACCNPAHLEVVTNRVNIRRGKNIKLTPDDVLVIYHADATTLQLGERFGVHSSHVSRIKNGRVWADVTEPERLPVDAAQATAMEARNHR